MRSEPSISAPVITAIDRGKTVKVLNYRSGWFKRILCQSNRVGI
ncbi:SH3 domain-containing protein [Brucella abortus]|nr:SH3 domain-containing protein [Brucella abortus]